MSGAKTLTLHIGGEKTGSKSIQRWLAHNAGVLARRHRILYPVRAPLSLRGAHYPILSSFLPAKRLDFVASARRIERSRLREALAALPADGIDDIVLSAEHLSSRLDPPHIAALRDVTRAALPDHRVRVVYHCRAQSSQYCAALSSYLKTLGAEPRPAVSVTAAERFYDHHRVASDWADVFGDDALVIRNFHGADPVVTFRAALGRHDLPLAGVSAAARNPSLSYEEAAVLAAVNTAFGPADFGQEDLIRIRRRVQQMMELHLRAALPVRTPLAAILEPSDWRHFEQQFSASNDRLTERFRLDFNLNDHMVAGAKEAGRDRPKPLTDPIVQAEVARWTRVIGDRPRRSITEAKRVAGRLQRLLGGLLLRHALRGRLELRHL